MRNRRIITACLTLTLLAGCANRATDATSEPLPEIPETNGEISVWSAYWDKGNDVKIATNRERFDRLVVFAAYFQDEKLFVPEESKRILIDCQSERDPGFEVWLSVVNDRVNGEVSTQKDTEILWQLFENEETMEAHAEELVVTAEKYSCDGIEIDYEKIRNDMDLWERFIRFEEILLEKANAHHLGVRIVLEPSTPIEALNLPKEACYVVMCYNLHGYGSQPGPKADYAFLKDIYERFSSLENVSYALANGGFVWSDNQVEALNTSSIPTTGTRDENSGALKMEENGRTIWYADEETIRLWTSYLEELAGKPVNISVWKL